MAALPRRMTTSITSSGFATTLLLLSTFRECQSFQSFSRSINVVQCQTWQPCNFPSRRQVLFARACFILPFSRKSRSVSFGSAGKICVEPAASSKKTRRMSMSSSSSEPNPDLAQDPSELFDIYPAPPSTSLHNSIIDSRWGALYYPSPQPTGERKARSLVHSHGDWHRSVQVWIVQAETRGDSGDDRPNIRVLLQRRSPYKDTHPNLLDVSCAGHLNAGDDAFETTQRELQEELGGNGALDGKYSLQNIKQSKIFTVASAIQGVTDRHGKFTCREYQDVFLLWWDCETCLDARLFAPEVKEEVAGFEVMDGVDLIQKLRDGDENFVPRSLSYVNALAKAIGCVP